MEDPEFGPNFIQPLKSQGVREVGDSVMLFRVKFTAIPGKHFLIRREALKRITLALEKEGIHYDHSKVIVDFPAPPASTVPSGGSQTQPAPDLAAAGAAAAFETILEEEKKEKTDKEKKTRMRMLLCFTDRRDDIFRRVDKFTNMENAPFEFNQKGALAMMPKISRLLKIKLAKGQSAFMKHILPWRDFLKKLWNGEVIS